MNGWVPYLGTTLVILVAMAALVVLARQGVHLRRFKHDKTELEFEHFPLKDMIDAPGLGRRVSLTEAMVQLTTAAKGDCETLHISPEDPIQFVLGEGTRHPILFEAQFTSLPLVFREDVLLLSWDGSQATVERILNRKQAYPLNDAWSSCLGVYRQATLLAYRTKGPEQLYTSTEARRAIAVYRGLVSKVNHFLGMLRDSRQHAPDVYRDLGQLIEEAEFALANDDIGTSVARLEVVLSTVHKLILQCAPQGPLSGTVGREAKVEVRTPDHGGLTVLVVDDQQPVLEAVRRWLEKEGFAVTAATTTTDALRAMVEHDFDLVITDLVMGGFGGPQADGREVALAAKRSSKKTKVIVLTVYYEMSIMADLFRAGVDDVFFKGDASKDLLAKIDALLGKPRMADKRTKLKKHLGAR